MSETLKNCPFCGEEAYVIIDRGGNADLYDPEFHVGCVKNESCRGYATKRTIEEKDVDREVKAWNKRVTKVDTDIFRPRKNLNVAMLGEEIEECAVNGCSFILRLQWDKESDARRCEVIVMLEADDGFQLKKGLRFRSLSILGKRLSEPTWGYQYHGRVNDMNFRHMASTFTGNTLCEAKERAREFLQKTRYKLLNERI